MDQYDRWAEQSTEKCPELYQLAGAMLDEGMHVVGQVETRNGDHLNTIRILLFGRVMSGTRALVLLCRYGFLTEADILLRSNIEALFRLTALIEKPEMLSQYLAEDYPRRRKAMSDVRELLKDVPDSNPSSEDIDAALRKIDREETDFLKSSGLAKSREIKVWEWALAGKQADVFHAKYLKHSNVAHHAARDLERRMTLTDDGQSIRAISFCPETNSPDELLRDALVIFGIALVAYGKCAGVGQRQELDDAVLKLNSYFDDDGEQSCS